MKKPGVTLTKDALPGLQARIKALATKRVMVGIPAENAQRDDGSGVSNALIGYVQEYGCPEKNIPPRPFLVPGVASIRDDAVKVLRKVGVDSLEGNAAAANNGLNEIGLRAEAAVKNKMDEGPFTPLADATVEARARRGRPGAAEELTNRKDGQPAGTDLAQPLIDTGNLQQHITYVIRTVKAP
ncbi:hypothetical protein [Komagataeibacter sp. FNDCF1]|uniref:hypothetical protein n=1 Tax=Komagataeibacter sp. FNDCF1 TaxID=2878681 RepID=UPI001E31A6E5|nr:hypothetical protein [Komagataeibacter sp. FNDCF1]MCE2563376.1 hypothetical protein [Komagataeibacter sp. FNDCF1]